MTETEGETNIIGVLREILVEQKRAARVHESNVIRNADGQGVNNCQGQDAETERDDPQFPGRRRFFLHTPVRCAARNVWIQLKLYLAGIGAHGHHC